MLDVTDGSSIGVGWPGDQAAGLRRLFGGRLAQVLAFAFALEGGNCTSLVMDAALDLARAGRRVLVIDEQDGTKSAAASLGLTVHHDFFDVLQGNCGLRQALLPVEPLLDILPAKFAARELDHAHRSSEMARRNLSRCLTDLQRDVDFILINSVIRRASHLSAITQAARHLAVVMEASGTAITQAYSLIKRVAQEKGRDDFHVLMTQVKSLSEAEVLFKNLSHVAANHLGVQLMYLYTALKQQESKGCSESLAEAIMQSLSSTYDVNSGLSGGFMGLHHSALERVPLRSRSRSRLAQSGAVGMSQLDSVV